ncbi:MAG TPA: ATP-binding protein [Pirellulales bacterium]|jgi:PAS domain S-box-containing protein/excisionase family DNA binding protein|nr:ATP-binding protein [Pirellulales bacterium]
MSQTESSPNFAAYRTVGEAAEYLGVSRATLRNWDRAGKLQPRRHPQNGYRIYLHEDLEALLRSTDLSTVARGSTAAQVEWDAVGENEHFVQFYDSDALLVDSISRFARSALAAGHGSVIMATAEHRGGVEQQLATGGLDVPDLVAAGRLVLLDAAETLSRFMIAGSPDAALFGSTVGETIARMTRGGRRIHAFGEMVALLWTDGNRAAAIRLEELWNDLGKEHRFALCCAYPIAGFGDRSDEAALSGVCDCHTRVVPVESYAAIDDDDARLRAVAHLQQKAQSLEAEIAHREEVEKSLLRRERELADFVENAAVGLHKVGPDGTILWANQAECDLLGSASDEVVGRSVADFHADPDVIAELLAKLQAGEAVENFPARLRCRNGRIKHVLISSNACFEEGRFAYTRCFTRDVTRQWEAENALRDADRRKDEFLATLAHELRNPLAPLKNALELLKLAGPNPEVVEDVREIMQRQVEQMSRLVDDLLDVSRITRDRIELRKERVELAAVVGSAVETSRPLIDAARHELSLQLPAEPVFLEVDPVRMAQVFSNLLNNSAKYTLPGGRIRIEAWQEDGEAVVMVQDNGLGISPDALAHVFDMFRQVDRTLERSQGGLGIGLTVVRRLVELHSGSINAQSDGLCKGSAFVVRLPVAAAKSRRPATKPTRVAKVPKRRILVVDDNKDAGDTLGVLLRAKGHEVRMARDGVEAVEVAAEFLPDVILMDVGMPKMNGHDAARQIRQMPALAGAFIIALTGWGQADDVQRSLTAGCSAHLTKPVDFAALDELLVNWEKASH